MEKVKSIVAELTLVMIAAIGGNSFGRLIDAAYGHTNARYDFMGVAIFLALVSLNYLTKRKTSN